MSLSQRTGPKRGERELFSPALQNPCLAPDPRLMQTFNRFFVFCVALSVLLTGLAPAESAGSQPSSSPVKPPMDRSAAKSMFDAWKAPVPPRHLIGNIYYVGAIGVSSYLITTPAGHILIDTGFEETVPLIQHSVEQLGFKLSDIRIMLSSHAHIDHTGGHALMKKLTRAQVMASAEDARILASGGADDFIPFPKDMIIYPPVAVDHIVNDGAEVTLGGVTLTAHLTPGHTRGATTWTMDVAADGQSYHVVFFSSASISPGTSLLLAPPYPELVQDFENTFARLKQLPCDIFFAPHGGQFAMAEKFAQLERNPQPNPFIDPAGWRSLIDNAEKAFRGQLAAERTQMGQNPSRESESTPPRPTP